jgi:porphobilinogen synthase
MVRMELRRRLRRNRHSAAIRRLVQETVLTPADFIQPMFVHDGGEESEPIASMPGQCRWPASRWAEACGPVQDAGIPAVAVFPRIDAVRKDLLGSYATSPDNWLFRALREAKRARPGLVIIADVALDPYTSHGHDGVLDTHSGDVTNDATVEILARQAVLLAEAGADWVAPSDMMDGRVAAIREALDGAGCQHTGILAYSAKFASSLYGPFRDAVGSLHAAGTAHLDKRTYQLNPANRREALLEAALDEDEGADVLMVKPAGMYLDILRELREQTALPVAAYQVSGEYAMIHAAAERGWLDLARARDESLLAIKRAGADMILTYFAVEAALSLPR